MRVAEFVRIREGVAGAGHLRNLRILTDSATSHRNAQLRRRWAAIAVSAWLLAIGGTTRAEPASAARDFSGWRGGIGITFGTPSRDIADVTEMGYEVVWGGEDPRAVKALGFSQARDVAASEEVVLDTPAARRRHFDAREGHTYCLHLYGKRCSTRWKPPRSRLPSR